MEVQKGNSRFYFFIISILITFLFSAFSSYSFAQGVEVFNNLGLYGGQIYDIAIDPSNPDKMFAGSYMGDGLFMTTDGGFNWQAVETDGIEPNEDDFKNQINYAVKIAPSNSDVIWVAHGFWAEKSTDGGVTWTHIKNSTMQNSEFRFSSSLVIDPFDSHTVYVGTGGPSNTYTDGAIYKTTDGGITWTKMNQGNDFDFAVEDMDIDPQNSNILWAVTNSQGRSGLGNGWGGTLYRSEDGGVTWTEIFSLTNLYGTNFGTSYFAVAADPNDQNTVLTGGGGTGIIRFSLINGIWSYGGQPCLPFACVLVKDIVFDSTGTVYATWLSPISWGGDGIGKVWRSTDGGYNWEDPYTHDYDFKTLAVHPTNSEIIFAGEHNEGIFKSEDHGQTWSPVNKGISAINVYDVAVDPYDSDHIIAATFAGLYEKKGSEPWSLLLDDTARSVLFHPTVNDTFYAGLEGSLASTSNGAQSWNYVSIPGTDGWGYNYVSEIAIDAPSDTLFISVAGFTGYGEIYKSTDGGASFFSVLSTGDLLAQGQINQEYAFNAVSIDPSDHQHIFAGGGNFFAPKVLGDLWESIDSGGSWSKTSLQNVIINALLIDHQNPDIIYAGAGYSGGTDVPLYKSTDSGATWTSSFEGIPGSPPWNAVTDLAFHRVDSNIIYVSTDHQGIYVSSRSRNWLNLGTPKYDVYAIATSSLYAATERGLLQLTGAGVLTGKITDTATQQNINNAAVCNDFGVQTASIDGEYLMVSPAGICSIAVVAAGYGTETVPNKTVYGGDVTYVNISMQGGVSDPSAICGQNTNIDTYSGASAGAGKVCFIATVAYGSPLSKQVEILRSFRDNYLLPYEFGKKMVGLYYRTGKPAAKYIESHPWLKPFVRIILYPFVGVAWLMLITSAFNKLVTGLCFLAGSIVIVKKIRLRRKVEN